MNPKNRQHQLIIATIAVVGLLLVNYVIYNPLQALWNARREEITKLSQNVKQGHDKIRLEQNPATSRKEQWLKLQAGTLDKDQSKAVQQLNVAFNRWCQNSGAHLTSMSTSPFRADRSGEFKTLESNAVASGTVENIVRFLLQAEQDKIGLKEQSIEVTSADFSGLKLSVHLQLSALVLTPKNPQPQSIAKAL